MTPRRPIGRPDGGARPVVRRGTTSMATTISEARLRANRENARKSTGPRTEAGKARSRRNAVRHGLSGAGVALAEGDEKALKERLAKWKTELWPDGEAEEALVACAALATVRLERCRVSESARLARRRRHAVDDWERGRRLEVEALGRELLGGGEVAAKIELERTSQGCDWLIGRWRGVAAELRRKGRLDAERSRLALLLAGVRHDDPLPDRKALAWIDAIGRHAGSPAARRGAPPGCGSPTSCTASDREARLRAALLDEADRAGIADEALVDTSHEGALHRRYESASESALHRSLSRLERLRSGIRDGRGSPVAPPKTRKEWIGDEWVEMPATRPRSRDVDRRPFAEDPELVAFGTALLRKSAERQRLKDEARAKRRAERDDAAPAAAPVEPRREAEPETKPTSPPVPRPDLRRRVGRSPAPALRASALGLVLALVALGAGGARRDEPKGAGGGGEGVETGGMEAGRGRLEVGLGGPRNEPKAAPTSILPRPASIPSSPLPSVPRAPETPASGGVSPVFDSTRNQVRTAPLLAGEPMMPPSRRSRIDDGRIPGYLAAPEVPIPPQRRCAVVGRTIVLLVLSSAVLSARADEPKTPTVLGRHAISRGRGVIIVPVRYAGRECAFVVDTGFSLTVFDSSFPLGPPRDITTVNPPAETWDFYSTRPPTPP